MSEDRIKTIARISLQNGKMVVTYWIGDSKIGAIPLEVKEGFEIIIREINPGLYGLSLNDEKRNIEKNWYDQEKP